MKRTMGMKAILAFSFVLAFFVAMPAAAGTGKADVTVSSAPGASGSWSDPLAVKGDFNILVYGASWSATVTLQVSFDSGTTWYDTNKTYTANTVTKWTESESGVLYRIGVDNGDYSSGSVYARISF